MTGFGMFLFGAYHLVRHIGIQAKKKRESDKDFKEYTDFKKEYKDLT